MYNQIYYVYNLIIKIRHFTFVWYFCFRHASPQVHACISLSLLHLSLVLYATYARSTIRTESVCMFGKRERNARVLRSRWNWQSKNCVRRQGRGTINTSCVLEWIFRPVSTGSSLPFHPAIRRGHPPDRRRIIYVSPRRTIMSKRAITPIQPSRRSSSFTLSGNIR